MKKTLRDFVQSLDDNEELIIQEVDFEYINGTEVNPHALNYVGVVTDDNGKLWHRFYNRGAGGIGSTGK